MSNFAVRLLLKIFASLGIGLLIIGCGGQPKEDPDPTPASTSSVNLTLANSYDFSSHEAGAIIETTLVVSYAGDTSAIYINSTINNSGFTFKGGSYPGIGGSCGALILADCTLVIRFKPTNNSSYSSDLSIIYDSSGTTKVATINLLGQGTLEAPDRIRFNSPTGIVVNNCTPLSLESTTSSNQLSAVTSDLSIGLNVNNGSGFYYSDSLCSTNITSTTILTGNSSSDIYFQSSVAPQNLTLIATSSLGNTNHTLNIGLSAVGIYLSLASEIENNTCTQTKVYRVDTNGYSVSEPSVVTVNLTNDKALQFFQDNNCGTNITQTTINAYADSGVFYVKNATTTPSITVTTTDSSSTLTSDIKVTHSVATLSWWDLNFTKRIAITVNNLDQASTHIDIPVLIKLNPNRFEYGYANADGSDLRFLANDHLTLLSHEVESWSFNGTSFIWVKVNSIAASTQETIYLYYGNSKASAAPNVIDVWSSYQGVWHLGEDPTSTGPQFKDSVLNSNNGTATNNPTSVSGVFGNAIDLNGDFDAVTIGYDLATVIGANSTFMAWMKTPQVGDNTMWRAPGITGVEEAGGGNDIFFGWLDASGYIGVTSGNGAASKSNFVVNDNAWRHVTITRNASNGASQFFINGVLNGSGNSEAGVKTSSFYDFGVIADTGGTPTEFDGQLDEIRLYNSVVDNARIRADFKYMNDTHISYGAVEIQN